MIVVIYKGKGREGTKQVPFTSKALAIKKAKDLYKKGYCNVKVSEISEKVLFIPGRTIWLYCEREASKMGDCEDCLYYHLGTCEEAEPGTEATCFVDYNEEE